MKNNFFKKKMNVENTTFLETDTRFNLDLNGILNVSTHIDHNCDSILQHKQVSVFLSTR